MARDNGQPRGGGRSIAATLHLRDDLRVERGNAQLRADIRAGRDGHTEEWNVTGKVADLTARLGEKSLSLPEPATLVAKLERRDMAAKLERFEIQSSFLTANGQGDLDRGIVVTATLDLAAFHERFRDWIELGGIGLAGKGKLEANYRRSGTEYQAGLDAEFRDLRLAGLPVVEKLERDLLKFDGKLVGAATSAGWPISWKNLSAHGFSGDTDVKLSAQTGALPDTFVVTGRASTALTLAQRRHRLEGDLKAKSVNGAWTADRLALASGSGVKMGPGARSRRGHPLGRQGPL